MNKIKIALADDHDMVRQGLESVLSSVKHFEIIETASSGEQLLQSLKSIQPDLVILDIVMPGMNGIQVAKKIKSEYPEIKILMLSMEISSDYIKDAVKCNVDGYLPKNADISILTQAVTTIAGGQQYFDPKVKDYIFKYFVNDESLAVPQIQSLSQREVQVLKMISNGISNKEIGAQLFISPKTVEAHRNNILKKLYLKSTADLVKFAIAKNITEIPKDMLESSH
ncbi:MAG: response regulator transcription factor [Bacteroidota bacterium]